nr:NADH dehydrogenase subunit 5 [Pseudolycoriella hygida]
MCFISFFIMMFISLNLFITSLYLLFLDFSIYLEFEIISLNSCSLIMVLMIDWMSLLFMSFVMFISSMVILYSKEYMNNDMNLNRFILLIMGFVLSMMMLIISPNLISILLGWDGLGLISYCLVIYYQNLSSYNAGMLTALSNRIGDVALLMSIAWMLNYGSWNFLFYLNYMKNDYSMMFVSFMVVLASMTKSAQIPFSSWLPAAMAAPTPVSALVHSSTLVTAGVYLLIRFNFILLDSFLGQFLLLFSGLTMFMSGLGANFEFDLKKIIALSTLSQLGLMMMILCMGFFKLAFFHLLTHAMFKSLLFMCAGSIIHNMLNSQDIRLMGGLVLNMPLTCTFFNISNLSLCGMPFLSGFYSKDLIIELSMSSYLNFFILLIMLISTGLTVSYSFRLIYYSMVGNFNSNCLHPMNDEGWLMLGSMNLLVIMSLISGSMLMWLLFPTPYLIILPIYMKTLVLFICLIGGIIGYLISSVSLFFYNKSLSLIFFTWFVSSMWFMPFLSTKFIIYLPLMVGNLLKSVDQGWSEYLGSMELFNKMMLFTKIYQTIHFNNLKLYLLSFFMFFIFLLILNFNM